MFLPIAFLAALLFPFQSSAPAPAADNVAAIPAGLSFNCWVVGKLSSKNSKVGDPVQLEVVEDVKDSNGKIVLPRKAELHGAVTLAQKKAKDDKPALAIRVTEARWKGGSATLNGVFGGDVMVKESMTQMDPVNLTSHASGQNEAVQGLTQAEGYTNPDPKLGAILYAKHEIDLSSKNAVRIMTVP